MNDLNENTKDLESLVQEKEQTFRVKNQDRQVLNQENDMILISYLQYYHESLVDKEDFLYMKRYVQKKLKCSFNINDVLQTYKTACHTENCEYELKLICSYLYIISVLLIRINFMFKVIVLICWIFCFYYYYPKRKYVLNPEIIKYLTTKESKGARGVFDYSLSLSPRPDIRDYDLKFGYWKHFYKEFRKVLNKGNGLNSHEINLKGIDKSYGLPKDSEFITCKYKCRFCCLETKEVKGINGQTVLVPINARSYCAGEPAIDRAMQVDFDIPAQIRHRYASYDACGQLHGKAEVILLGGTWSSFSKDYRKRVITEIYRTFNQISVGDYKIIVLLKYLLSKYQFFHTLDVLNFLLQNFFYFNRTLESEMKINETVSYGVIGLTIETRCDCINPADLREFRSYGCTRIQTGLQTTNTRLLERSCRECSVQAVKRAIKLVKDAGFKIDIHIMPDLPHPLRSGVNPLNDDYRFEDIDFEFDVFKADIQMFDTIIDSPDYQVDQWKIYPCEIMKYTKFYEDQQKGWIKSYGDIKLSTLTDQELYKILDLLKFHDILSVHKLKSLSKFPILTRLHLLIIYVKLRISRSKRINRNDRDIPLKQIDGTQLIYDGNKDKNFRQTIANVMGELILNCNCIRCHEIGIKSYDTDKVSLNVLQEFASDGIEYFLSFNTSNNNLIGFLRLRLPNKENSTSCFPDLRNCAMIRELHVYGSTTPIHFMKVLNAQHRGYGTKLVYEAIKLAKKHGYTVITVISGNNVKPYYKSKFGFIDIGYDKGGYLKLKI